ncbi:MAG: hypothetical protein JWR07_2593, partial [Nevskia sp.]|nr:hypothetical protein [Nevskia sp.]
MSTKASGKTRSKPAPVTFDTARGIAL